MQRRLPACYRTEEEDHHHVKDPGPLAHSYLQNYRHLSYYLNRLQPFWPKPGLEKDKGKRDEVLSGLFVTYWKGAKISIRSLPITKETKSINFDEIKAQQARDLNLGHQLSRIYDWVMFLKNINEEPQKAVDALTRLEKSSYISGKEHKLIAESKAHIADRDPDSALNILTDKVMMTKLGLNYALSYATEIEWMLLLEKTEEGRRILKRFKELEQTLIKAKKYFDLDLIKEKSKKLFEDLKNSKK